MKKTTMAVAMAIMVLAGLNSASAEMVDIGLGQMEKAEFMALKSMVQEGRTNEVSTVSTPLEQLERYGPVEMSRADFDALRNRMAGVNNDADTRSIVTPAVRTVNIGTGEMPLDEFLALKRMVRRSHLALVSGQMAAAQP